MTKRLALGIALALASVVCHADEGQGPLIGAGSQLIWEREGRTGDLKMRSPLSFRAGWATDRHDLYFEYARFVVKDGEGIASVERRQNLWLGWLRRRFDKGGSSIAPTVAVGAGAEVTSVRTSLSDLAVERVGDPQFVLGLAPGALWFLESGFELGFEARAVFAQTFRPNPVLGVALSVGYRF